MTNEKVLQAHTDKSKLIIFRSEIFRKKTEEELKETPIYLTDLS